MVIVYDCLCEYNYLLWSVDVGIDGLVGWMVFSCDDDVMFVLCLLLGVEVWLGSDLF